MRWFRRAVGGLVLMLVAAGCASTQQVAASMGGELVGRNIDDVFVEYGIPGKSMKLNSGDVIHEWSAPTLMFSGIQMNCDVRFITTSDGTIKRLAIYNDTIGMWTTSRCAEVFGELQARRAK